MSSILVNIFNSSNALCVFNMENALVSSAQYDTEIAGEWMDDELLEAITKASCLDTRQPRAAQLWLGNFGRRRQLYISEGPFFLHLSETDDDPGSVMFEGTYNEVVATAVAYARML